MRRFAWATILLLLWFALLPAGAVQKVMLVWDPSPDEAVTGYRLYRGAGEVPIYEPIDVGNTNVFELADLSEEQIYRFFVTAYDAHGVESDPSNTLELGVPPPITITWPTASPISHGQTLTDALLSGGSASVTGSFAFTTPDLVPDTGTAEQSVTFTPADVGRYRPVNGTVSVTVNESVVVTAWPTASAIYLGQTLADSTLSGGSASVAGSFAFTTPGTIPGPGATGQSVTFTPAGEGSLSPVNGTVSVTVLISGDATVVLDNLNQIYDGTARAATATTEPPGLAVELTYDGSTDLPTAAGSYQVVGVIRDDTYSGVTTNVLVIRKASAAVVLGGLAQTFDGTGKAATVTTDPSGLAVELTYDGSLVLPTAAGTYQVVGSIIDSNFNGSATNTLVIGKARGHVVLDNLRHAFDGTAKAATVSTDPGGLAVEVFYDGGNDAPRMAGSYTVVGTITDANFAGSVTNTLTISKAPATVVLEGLSQTYDGTAKAVTAATDPAGLTVELTYDGGPDLPTGAGAYRVVGTIGDPNYTGVMTNMLVISKAPATIVLEGLSRTYDGTGKAATATTDPAGLTVELTYDGSPDLPTETGSYLVVGNISDDNFTGSVTNTLVIARAALITLGSLSYTYDGSAKTAVATADPGDLPVVLTYDGSPVAPTEAGGYTVVAIVIDSNYTGGATNTLVISKALAKLSLEGLSQTYDGLPKIVTAVTEPAGLELNITYDGAAVAPSAVGSYTVVATVKDTNYHGLVSGTLEIGRAPSVTTLVLSTNRSVGGSNLAFSATVGPVAPANSEPTGSVQFLTNGVAVGDPVPLVNRTSVIQVGYLPPGTNMVTAEYLGDGNHTGSSISLSQPIAGEVEVPVARHISIRDDGSVDVTFTGTPGAEYLVMSTTNAVGAWEIVSTNTAGPSGEWIYTDSGLSNRAQRFFRAAKP